MCLWPRTEPAPRSAERVGAESRPCPSPAARRWLAPPPSEPRCNPVQAGHRTDRRPRTPPSGPADWWMTRSVRTWIRAYLETLTDVLVTGEKEGPMPLTNYGVLVGRVVASRAEGGADSPHFQVHIRGSDTDFRIAVNVLSKEKPSELLYFSDEHFSTPLLALLPTLPEGFTELPSQRGGVALDFIRGNLFERTAMKAM